MAELEGQLAALQTLIAPRKRCGSDNQKLENLASRVGLGIVATTPTDPRLGDGYTAYPVTIHVRGDLRKLRRFLAALRGLPRIYNVTSVHISQAKEGGGSMFAANVDPTPFSGLAGSECWDYPYLR